VTALPTATGPLATLLDVRPTWTVLIPVLIVAIALAIPTTFGVLWLYVRLLYFPRIRRRILAVDRARSAGGVDAARGELAVWERHVPKRDYNALIVIARGWHLLGDQERALAALDRIRWPWWYPDRAFRRAADGLRYQVLREAGRNPAADALLNRALDRDPGAPWLETVRFEKAIGGEPPESLAAYERSKASALGEHPNIELLAKVASRAAALGRFDEAVALTRRLLAELSARERKPGGIVPTAGHLRNRALLHAAIGALLQGAGDGSGAEREFEVAAAELRDDEGRRSLAICRAEGLLYARRFSDAAAAFEGVASGRDDGRGLLELAVCRWQLRDLGGARRALERARELRPDLVSVRRLDAMLLVDEGKRDRAVEAIRREEGDPSGDGNFSVAYVRAVLGLPGAERSLRAVAALHAQDDPDVEALLDRTAPDGRTWREHLAEPSRPDLEAADGEGPAPP
jgi:tetratricopeptide (TPR) repeat protein